MAFILTLTAPIVLFGMGLTLALVAAHGDPEKAGEIIRAAGEWFPFRRRGDTHHLPGRDGER